MNNGSEMGVLLMDRGDNESHNESGWPIDRQPVVPGPQQGNCGL